MRLIDADVLEPHEQLEPMGNGEYEYVEVVYKDDIDDAPTIQKWIPVSERLPEDTSKPVLISGNYKRLGVYAVDIARYNGGMWQYDGFTFPDCDILAWMPLPEPYKEESE